MEEQNKKLRHAKETLDDAIVSNGSKLYERYRTRITDWNAEVRFGVELKR